VNYHISCHNCSIYRVVALTYVHPNKYVLHVILHCSNAASGVRANLHHYSPYVITSRYHASDGNSGKTGLNHGKFDHLWQKSPTSSPSPMTNRADAVFEALANLADLADGSLVIRTCQLWLQVPSLATRAAKCKLHSEHKCKLHFTVMCKNTGVNLLQGLKIRNFHNPKHLYLSGTGAGLGEFVRPSSRAEFSIFQYI